MRRYGNKNGIASSSEDDHTGSMSPAEADNGLAGFQSYMRVRVQKRMSEGEWKAAQNLSPDYYALWQATIDQDATEYVYWHGHVPTWWPCDPDGVSRK